jgi:hypothetical protein
MSKACTRCMRVKSLDLYYSDKRASDGKCSQCKECNKEQAWLWRTRRKDHVNSLKRAWRKANPDKVRKETREQRAKNPKAYKARTAVANALATGKLKKSLCAFCLNSKVQAHHLDYSKPLEVVWLCAEHHGMHHRLIRNMENRNGK